MKKWEGNFSTTQPRTIKKKI